MSRMSRSNSSNTRIYVGNLPDDIRANELEEIFGRYGRISDIEIKIPKTGKAPAFAFLQYDDPRDVDDAIRARDGYDFGGQTLRVEIPSSRGSKRRHDHGPPAARRPPPERSHNRLLVSGLPFSGSWQDIKDHCRDAGEVVYADVFRDGTGVVEFARKDDMRWAIDNLDNTSFRSHEGESSRVRFRIDGNYRDRERSRSRSPPRRGGGYFR